MDKRTMQQVLADLHMAESAIEMKQLPPDSSQKVIMEYYQQILHQHKITPEQLFNNFEYYLNHPDKMDALYQEMLNDLSKKEEELRNR